MPSFTNNLIFFSFGYSRQGRPNHLPVSTTTTTGSFPNQSSTNVPRHSSVGPLYRQPLLDNFCDNNFTNQYEVPFVYNLRRNDGKPSQVDGRQTRLTLRNSLRHQNLNVNNNVQMQKQQRGYLTYQDDF